MFWRQLVQAQTAYQGKNNQCQSGPGTRLREATSGISTLGGFRLKGTRPWSDQILSRLCFGQEKLDQRILEIPSSLLLWDSVVLSDTHLTPKPCKSAGNTYEYKKPLYRSLWNGLQQPGTQLQCLRMWKEKDYVGIVRWGKPAKQGISTQNVSQNTDANIPYFSWSVSGSPCSALDVRTQPEWAVGESKSTRPSALRYWSSTGVLIQHWHKQKCLLHSGTGSQKLQEKT